MGNCCSIKSQQKRQITPTQIKYNKQDTQRIQDNQVHSPNTEKNSDFKETSSQQQQQQEQAVVNKVPALPKKARVKETVKMVQTMDKKGNKIMNQYILSETLGRGTFGKVKKAQHQTTGKLYAIKILKKSILEKKREFIVDEQGKRKVKNALEDVRKEIAIMKKLNHENVVKLYEVIEYIMDLNKEQYLNYSKNSKSNNNNNISNASKDVEKKKKVETTLENYDQSENEYNLYAFDDNDNEEEQEGEEEDEGEESEGLVRLRDKIFMVMDYADGGQIIDWDEDENKWVFVNKQFEGKLAENDLKRMLRQCVCGLNYLHKHNIIHRDIKPQNILFKDNMQTAMLADFGVSTVVNGDDDKINNTQGTYFFMSPEQLNHEGGQEGYSGKAADIWALGVSMYCFAYREMPIASDDHIEYMEKIQTAEIKYPSSIKYSSGFKNLMKQLLEKDPSKRITLEEIANNEWINEGFDIPLSEQMKINKLEEIDEEDILQAVQVSTLVRIKNWVRGWVKNYRTSNNTLPNTTKSNQDVLNIHSKTIKQNNLNHQGSALSTNQINITSSKQ